MSSLKRFLGAGFGSGYVPVAPGTSGSLAALILVYFSFFLHPILGPVFIVLLSSILTFWVTPACVEAWGEDPGTEVIDEFAGQSLVFISIPLSLNLVNDWPILLAGFLLFRLFDVTKILGIHKLQKFKGAAGILADDILAGFYALICLKTLIFLVSEFF
jgi:phosphatidylglycerophosphatase A